LKQNLIGIASSLAVFAGTSFSSASCSVSIPFICPDSSESPTVTYDSWG